MLALPVLLVLFVVLVLAMEEKPRRATLPKGRIEIPKPWSLAVYHDLTVIRRRKAK